MNKPKILITGASGFIGSVAAQKLSLSGYKVSILGRTSSLTPSMPSDVLIYKIDSEYHSIYSALKDIKPDLVIHCATLYMAEHASENLEDLAESNILYPLKLLEAMNQMGCKKIINLSSMWQHQNGILRNPVNLYAAMKNSFECLIGYYSNVHKLKAVNLYLSDTYGPNDKRKKLIGFLMDRIRNYDRNILAMSPGWQTLDLLHVDDVVNAIALLVEGFLNNQSPLDKNYQITSKVHHNLRQLIRILEDISGKELNVSWGERPYRINEVMTVQKIFPTPEGWSQKISLEDGLSDLLGKFRE